MTSHVHLNDLHPIVADLETVNEAIHDLVFDAPESSTHETACDFALWSAHQRRLCYFVNRLEAHMAQLRKVARYEQDESEEAEPPAETSSDT